MTTQSVLFDVDGELPTQPRIHLQPTAQRAAPVANAGWKWRRRYTLTNTGDAPVFFHPHAIDLGDTTPLTTAKALASGNDVRVWINGREVRRTLVDWDSATHTTLCWIVIPYLAAGGTMLVEVVYGNASAGSPPTLTAMDDLPAFDIAATGANRSSNTKWIYKTDRVAANAGKGGWGLSSGTAQPDVNYAVPGGWSPILTRPGSDDCKQEAYSTYIDSGMKYQGRFQSRRARAGALVRDGNFGADGVFIRVPTGIASVRSDIRWINQAIGDTDTTPVGQVVILTRNQAGEDWKTLYSNAALQATEATIATATYTPAAAVKEVAYAVWPQDGLAVDLAARADRYIEAAWYTTLEVNLTASVITQTTTQAETEVYEIANELRSGGGGDTAAVPAYKSIYLGNYALGDGKDTPRAAVELNQQVVIDTARQAAEVWNSGLTARVEDFPLMAINAVDGLRDTNGSTIELFSADWMPFLPQVDPLTNSSAETDANNWTRGDVTADVTAGAISRDATTFDSTPAGFSVNITANTAGAGAIVENIADDYLPVGTRENVQVGAAVRTADTDLQPTLSVWFYDEDQVLLGGRYQQADWTVPAANAWYRRLFAVAVPEGAVFYRVGLTIKDKAGAQTGIVRWDTVAVNDTEIALLDVAAGAKTLSARWQPRYGSLG